MEIGGTAAVGSDGLVQLVDVMGSDKRVCDAARISYGQHEGDRSHEENRKLLRYMMRHRHTSPFEQCEMVFIIRIPMDAWRQMIRHRTANVNEYSTRYSPAIDSAAVTAPDAWRTQATDNKQGSGGKIDLAVGHRLSGAERELQDYARLVYEERIEAGVAREQARKDLPLSTYTEAYWKIDLHNLLHYLSLRLDPHAQLEIREYATVIAGAVRRHFPETWEAFEDYRLHAVTFTGPEIEGLREVIGLDTAKLIGLLEGREQDELVEKLRRTGW